MPAAENRIRELRDRLRAEKGLRKVEAGPRIGPRDRSVPAPLSFAQQRLWFVQQLDPSSPAYNMPGVVRIVGRIDEASLEASLAAIVERHEVLRTVIQLNGSEPVQVVRSDIRLALVRRNLELRAGESAPEALERLADEEALRGFSLTEGPLLRATLVRGDGHESHLFITLHHIVFDGWSMGIFIRELAAGYAAALNGGARRLAPLPIQYADFAASQRSALRAEKLAEDLAYWKANLAGARRLEFPTDRPRPAVQPWAGSSVDFELAPAVGAGLARLSQEHQASLFMTLLAGFAVVLHRYTGQEDIVIGSPIANRNLKETEPLIGFFVNSLVLRAQVGAAATFLELLRQVREMTLAAYAHQDLPFEKLVDELGAERDLSRHPIFQVVFVLQNAPMEPLALPGAELSLIQRPVLTSKFDVIVALEDTAGGLRGRIEYSTALFDRATMLRLAGHYGTLLAAVVEAPHRRVSELPILDAGERAGILRMGRPPGAPPPAAGLIHREFEARVLENGGAAALRWKGKYTTYRELNARADGLARELRARGVGPEAIVALAAERSPEMIVGILGILKAGGAYLPLDPGYPQDRLDYMMADSGAKLLVTTPDLEARYSGSGVETVSVDQPREGASVPLRPDCLPEHPAYVIYTSGSTGRPKGVVVTHANVTRLLRSTESWFGFGSGDVWTLYHSFAFDFSVWELWGPLLNGGRLVIVPHLTTRDFEAFHRLLGDEGVTVLNQTPSAFRQLMAADASSPGKALLKLRAVIFGGEALELSSLRGWIERRGDEAPVLINMYGITETTVHVTYRRIRKADLDQGRGSVIGVPIPDLELHVLDRGLEPVPLGIAGELHVGGLGLARGYLGRPDLTAEKFVADPHGNQPGARLYRSGDLARRLPDGDIEYLGRIDDQVKIRGFRIELGEIESRLSQFPGVRAASVLTKARAAGEPRLVAYFVPHEGSVPAAAALIDFLRTTLPDYMVPAQFVSLPAFPLTGNGKLDRAALPDPGTERPEVGEGYVAPSNPIEDTLAGIWARALALDRVGVTDNFFALGGDSILSIRIIADAQKAGLGISVQDLFRFQCVRDLTRAVPSAAHTQADQTQVPFGMVADADRSRLPAGLEDAYPLAALQAGMVFHSEFDRESAVFHDVFTQKLRIPFDAARLLKCFDEAIARHPVLRTSFALAGWTEPLQWVHRRVPSPVVIGDWSAFSAQEQGARLRHLVDERKRARFDWKEAPFFKVHLHRLDGATSQFTIDFHHAILDGWSLATLLSSIFSEYLGGATALVSAGSFRDFVALERAARSSPASENFWRGQVADAKFLRLPRENAPVGSPRPPRSIHTETVEVTEETSAGLRAAAAAAGVPVKTLLLAAHLRIMSVFGGQRDVVTGVTLNGRPEREGGENALGLFLNTVPFRLLVEDESFVDLARRTFAQEQAIMPHRRFPLADIQKINGGDSLFETAFNFVHFHVYRSIVGHRDFEALGGEFYEETNFALIAHFSLDVFTSRIGLELKIDRSELNLRQVQGLAGCFQRCLEAIAVSPGYPVLRTSVLAPAERQWLLSELNDTAREYPRHRRVHQRFEEQVERTPDAIAVAAGAERLTYRELNVRANRLAHHLRSRGACPGNLVGLCVDRSLEMVIGLLGILKSGAGYLPLDPAYPAERLQGMVKDSGARLLLTAGTEATRSGDAETIDLRASVHGWANQSAENPQPAGGEEDMIYVIYTSGSTGQPKGAAVTHRGFSNLLDWYVSEFALDGRDATLLMSSFSFDLTQKNFYAPLITGATLHLLPPGPYDPDSIVRLIAREGVRLINCTPSAFYPLLEAAGAGWKGLATLRWVVLGGEPISLARVAPWLRADACRAEIANTYGPTECADIAAFYRLNGRNVDDRAFVPTGRPIQNVALLIADEALQPCPAGVAGELWIAGESLGLGYWRDPVKTEARFKANPYRELPGTRLYRTGDLARYGQDGMVEFLGRLDDQVKIRGFRIELGEIESVLCSCEGVRQAAAVARPGADGELRITGYVVFVGAPGSVAALRVAVSKRLPEQMIPSRFVVLDSLPLSANGKVDRRALPEPDEEKPVGDAPPADLATDNERLLAGIWSQVLRRGSIGANDGFFSLGGDSILSLQVVARARAAGLEITARDVFEHRTLSELAGVAKRTVGGERAGEPSEPAFGAVPLSPMQRWFFECGLAVPDHWNQAVLLEARDDVDVPALAAALRAVVGHHEGLRTRFEQAAGAWSAHVAAPGDGIELSIEDASRLTETERRGAIERWADALQSSLDLGSGTVVRASWMDFGPGQGGRLLLVIHHLVVDGVSWRILAEDLVAAYIQLRSGRPAEFPAATRSFRSWSDALGRSALKDPSPSDEDYWSGLPEHAPQLPADFPLTAGAAIEASEAVFRHELSESDTSMLLMEVAASHRSQINDLMLTALARVFAGWTGQSALWVDLETHGRQEVLAGCDVSRTIGWFTAVAPVWINLEGAPTREQALKVVKEQLRRLPNEGIGYGAVRYLGHGSVTERLRRLQAPEVIFNYLGQFDQALGAGAPFGVAPESAGRMRAAANRRSHSLQIVGRVEGGRLRFEWSYSGLVHAAATIEALASAFFSELLALAAQSASSGAALTPSDFKLMDLREDELDELTSDT